MAQSKFLREYRKSSVQGASPLQLVIMLYDGALKFMEAGKHAMAEKDIERQNASLQKAQKVVIELTACLDLQQGSEIAANLMGLYTYVLEQLVHANLADDVEAVDRCIRIMSELRESWVQVEKSLASDGTEESKAA